MILKLKTSHKALRLYNTVMSDKELETTEHTPDELIVHYIKKEKEVASILQSMVDDTLKELSKLKEAYTGYNVTDELLDVELDIGMGKEIYMDLTRNSKKLLKVSDIEDTILSKDKDIITKDLSSTIDLLDKINISVLPRNSSYSGYDVITSEYTDKVYVKYSTIKELGYTPDDITGIESTVDDYRTFLKTNVVKNYIDKCNSCFKKISSTIDKTDKKDENYLTIMGQCVTKLARIYLYFQLLEVVLYRCYREPIIFGCQLLIRANTTNTSDELPVEPEVDDTETTPEETETEEPEPETTEPVEPTE